MSEQFLGEIRMFSFDFPPRGWANCNGALLPINQNQALFSLLGTVYGGDGRTTFGLPDLRDRAPIHVDGGTHTIGLRAGEATHLLSTAELPSHTHGVTARATATTASPSGALWAASSHPSFAASQNTPMAAAAVASTGGGQAHDNMPPFLVIKFGIAITGIFPSQN
jgi:microcystin-dependent protein